MQPIKEIHGNHRSSAHLPARTRAWIAGHTILHGVRVPACRPRRAGATAACGVGAAGDGFAASASGVGTCSSSFRAAAGVDACASTFRPAGGIGNSSGMDAAGSSHHSADEVQCLRRQRRRSESR